MLVKNERKSRIFYAFEVKQRASEFHLCHVSGSDFVDENRDKVVDFHWNAADPWTIVSVSDDGESTGGGGTLQVTAKLVYYIHTESTNRCIKKCSVSD